MDLEKNINVLVGCIIEGKNIKAKKNINHVINLHFAKIDFIVKVAIIINITILNLFSFIFHQKFSKK